MDELRGLIETTGKWAGDRPLETPEQLVKIVVRELADNNRDVGVNVNYGDCVKQYVSTYGIYDAVVSLVCAPTDRKLRMFVSKWPGKLEAAIELLDKSQTPQEYEEREKEVNFWRAKSKQLYTKIIPPEEFWLGVSGWSQMGRFYGIIEGNVCTAEINIEAIYRDESPKIIEIYNVQPASMEEILNGLIAVPEYILRNYFARNFPRQVLAHDDPFEIIFEGLIYVNHEVTYNANGRTIPKTTSIKKTTMIQCRNRTRLAREHRMAARIMVPFGASTALAEYLRKLIEGETILCEPPVTYIAEMLTLTKILDFLGLMGLVGVAGM